MIRQSVLCALMLATILSVGTAQISVIVSKSSPNTATKADIKDFFSTTRLSWESGKAVLVVDQSETAVGKKFYDGFIRKPVNQIRVQWTKLVLSGQAQAPVKCDDDEAVKKAVAANPQAIGYIETGSLDGSVREIARIE